MIIAGGISSSDIQILLNKVTGDIIIIDMSESKVIDNDNDNDNNANNDNDNDKINSNDESLLLSYINEALTIIPDKYIDDAKLGIHNHHHHYHHYHHYHYHYRY